MSSVVHEVIVMTPLLASVNRVLHTMYLAPTGQ